MKPTEVLMQEHSAIQVMLKVLEEACRKLESGRRIGARDLERMVEFLKVFADGCHHAKEEEHLFPALEGAGIPREHGPIGVMLAEHDLGRGLIRRMSDALPEIPKGNGRVVAEFVQSARAYINLLTMHIEKENKVLFPMADVRLSAETQAGLVENFEKIEVDRIGIGKHEEFHALIRELKAAYLH